MPSNYDGSRTIESYFSKACYVSTGDYTTDSQPSGLGVGQLSRIQSLDWTVAYSNDFPTYITAAYESYAQRNPTPVVTLRWLESSPANERLLGLCNLSTPDSAALTLDSEKSLYLTVENTAVDAIGASGAGQSKTVIGLAQGVLTQYTLSAAVGGLIQAQASLEFLTSFIYSGQSGNAVPAVNYSDGSQVASVFTLPSASSQYTTPEPSGYLSTGGADYTAAIAATDLIMTFPAGSPFGVLLTGAQSCYIQSFSCTLAIGRHDFKPLGYTYPAARPVVWPIQVDLTTEAIVSSYQADQLGRFGCLTGAQQINIIVKQPCTNATLFGLYFSELQLAGQDFITSIGRNDVVNLRWHGIIANPFQSFIDPTVNYLVRTDNTGAWGVNW